MGPRREWIEWARPPLGVGQVLPGDRRCLGAALPALGTQALTARKKLHVMLPFDRSSRTELRVSFDRQTRPSARVSGLRARGGGSRTRPWLDDSVAEAQRAGPGASLTRNVGADFVGRSDAFTILLAVFRYRRRNGNSRPGGELALYKAGFELQRAALRRKSATHVSGIIRYRCARNGT